MPLAGKELVRLFEQQGWEILRRKGSHVIMGKGPLRVSIPQHRELKKGLEMALRKLLE
jgi:predicted RNA binding protein YcfA (HicA-like mRNA interferase family)